jgi:hypothetical protein
MNLIMSDVEETIMIVDPESAMNGQGVINVYFISVRIFVPARLMSVTGCKTENGDAFCTRG